MERKCMQLDVSMPSAKISGTRRLLADIKKRTLRSRILSTLFGEQHEVVIIMPSRNVDAVTFTRTEEEKGGEQG